MHMVDGEHGHCHGHEHDHEHCHEHTHDHSHEGCGCGCGDHKPGSEQEARFPICWITTSTMLRSWLRWRRSSARQERKMWRYRLRNAIENFDKGNLYLSLALSLVQ